MTNDDGKKTNEGDGEGTKTNPNTKDNTQDANPSPTVPQPLEEAKAINEKKAELLDREEKLMARKEKLHAEEMVGGHTKAGQTQEVVKEETDKEYAQRISRGELKEGEGVPYTEKNG